MVMGRVPKKIAQIGTPGFRLAAFPAVFGRELVLVEAAMVGKSGAQARHIVPPAEREGPRLIATTTCSSYDAGLPPSGACEPEQSLPVRLVSAAREESAADRRASSVEVPAPA